MADAVLGVVLQNISSLLQKEFGLAWGVDGEMRRLAKTLATIQAVLEDAEIKQFKDKAIQSWLKELKDAAYDAEDILDEGAAKALQLEEQMTNCSNCNNCINQVILFVLSWFNFEQLMFRFKIAHKIKDIRKRFDDIAKERSNFHLNSRGIVGRSTTVGESSSPQRETSSILTIEHPVYGREEDKEVIIKQLLDNISKSNFLVYPIIGIGGLGKTTLAQLVYNDERVKNHFEARIWVCVSDDFDVKRLTKSIIEAVGEPAPNLTNLDLVQNHLREMLSRKRRFLLVLDDVWDEDQDKWESLKSSLTCGNKGSAILVTTRIEKVASIMGTCPAHYMKELSNDDCWDLFKQRAFGSGREETANLVAIGKEIVKKCRGVPLAAKSLGGLMRFKHTETEWLFVKNSEIWDLPVDKENTILQALRLSYNHLPPYLRQCFAYCSIFPKDCEIGKEQLVQLWMANGFFPSSKEGKMELEDIGNEIFNELLWRSFFQDATKDDDGNIMYCKMHDLVHDLACSVMGNECLNLNGTSIQKVVPKGIRHLSMNWGFSDSQMLVASITEYLHQSQSLRTLFFDEEWPWSDKNYMKVVTDLDFSNLICLRALDLNIRDAIKLPSSIGHLIHLRYLKLSGENIRTLPESLSNLKHLQTLKLVGCWQLQKLPARMSTISSLRHLDNSGCCSLCEMPIGIGRLIHLQTLGVFTVGKKSGYHISELQGLNLLRGEICIQGLENVKNSVDAKEANLIGKRNLGSLTLSWSLDIDDTQIQENAEEVLEGLQPPASIRRLRIERYQGLKLPSWMEDLSLLQNLVHIDLINCHRCEHFPCLGYLPLLKFLYVSGMDYVRHLGGGGGGKGNIFPLLEQLNLVHMRNLEQLLLMNVGEGREVLVLPRLVSMTIEKCNKLTTLPFLPSLQSLFLQENEHIPEGLLQNLPALKELKVHWCHKLITLPRLLCFSSLNRLEVMGCHAMTSLWEDETQFQGFCSLKSLQIGSCDSLASLSGMRYLIALQYLEICGCPELELSQLDDFRHLTSLQQLIIWKVPKLMSLPDSLKHAIMLQRLQIVFCEGLTALPEWIHNLTSLQTIEILECSDFNFLPDGLRQFTTLRTLEITNCTNDLKTQCRPGGEDWHKIAHIPNVSIGYGNLHQHS